VNQQIRPHHWSGRLPLANARDVADWMGVPTKSLFNFSPRQDLAARDLFPFLECCHRTPLQQEACVHAVARHFDGESAIVYVPSRLASSARYYRSDDPSGEPWQVPFIGRAINQQDIYAAPGGTGSP
jgi:hypothetical protein